MLTLCKLKRVCEVEFCCAVIAVMSHFFEIMKVDLILKSCMLIFISYLINKF